MKGSCVGRLYRKGMRAGFNLMLTVTVTLTLFFWKLCVLEFSLICLRQDLFVAKASLELKILPQPPSAGIIGLSQKAVIFHLVP